MKKHWDIIIDIEKLLKYKAHWNDKMPMMAMEECGELIQAISKIERYPDNHTFREQLVDEIRDVYMCLISLQIRYGISLSEINKKIDIKQNQ